MPGTIFPGIIQLARPFLIDLQAAEDREVEMAPADEAERHRAIERAGTGQRGHRTAARIGQRGMRHALFRRHAGPYQSILGLKEDMHALGQMICHQGRDSDTEVHQHSRRELAGNSARDDRLRFHSALMRWQRGSRRPAQA
jgi:hypothetical protein